MCIGCRANGTSNWATMRTARCVTRTWWTCGLFIGIHQRNYKSNTSTWNSLGICTWPFCNTMGICWGNPLYLIYLIILLQIGVNLIPFFWTWHERADCYTKEHGASRYPPWASGLKKKVKFPWRDNSLLAKCWAVGCIECTRYRAYKTDVQSKSKRPKKRLTLMASGGLRRV